MNAVAIGRTDAPSVSTNTERLQRLAAFVLAGMALFGFVLDEYDVPHDNPQGFIVLGSGALVGLIAGVV